ncbi:HPr family phosphocarrier protein [Priestia filamentosa]|uniref:Aldolase n=1 Tax=Priestia filamentosa TaxID=1402861 RepID=A0A1X7EA26_9BACI|nr:HPr family phosphocarrier protein [Priestia filamentosa]AKO92637.1 aldolase [Priestia filamentosa]MDT3762717.1 HPr family phosphocarrier protein [Priestia filamentosa]OXS69253.1 HPr family phosphocarrier protein [Priestia filamentosa]RJS64036.1 HPr family phosphocarrier protein [Priestia filamentosa]WRU97179.1 HPr family phosphocarrier protein [Priestia filamentosa]
MLMKNFIVQLPRGLQARHTALFVRKVSSFKSEVILSKSGKVANGKDIMKIMDLVIKEGDEITLVVHGFDEQAVMETLKKYLSNLT